MKYLGSKNRISKEVAPIIQSYITEDCKGYLEPFVGGANMIDKIKCNNKIGCDIHKYLIALLKQVSKDVSNFPLHISEQEYEEVKNNKEKFEDWYVGLVGFCATFSSKWFSGYARSFKSDGITPRDMSNEAIRNLIKQAPKLKNINFICTDFRNINSTKINNFVIYCDPPYRNSTNYVTGSFPYEEFYEWCKKMSKNNIVLVSEYFMPRGFECIWQKQIKVSIDSQKIANDEKMNRIEKLFIMGN